MSVRAAAGAGRGGVLRRAAGPILRLAELWTTDAWLATMLALLAAGLFVLGPLFVGNAFFEVLVRLVFAAVLVAGVLAVSRRSIWVYATALFCLLTAALSGVRLLVPSRALTLTSLACNILAVASLASLLTGQVFRANRITRYQVIGAIGVYLLVGLLWSYLYELIEAAAPGSFRAGDGGAATGPNLFYFSLVTLTTVGYGDVTAVAPLARSAAVVEGLVGQLYPAILIARLVAMELAGRAGPRS